MFQEEVLLRKLIKRLSGQSTCSIMLFWGWEFNHKSSL